MGRGGSILFLAIGLLTVACGNDLDKVGVVELPGRAPDRVTVGAAYYYSDNGVVRNQLKAGRIAEWTQEPQRKEMSEGVEILFFDSLGRAGSTLTAERGVIVPAQKRMEVMGHVVFINAKGERLETEHLTWEEDSARVFTDDTVRVHRGLNVIKGKGLDAAEDFSRYTVRQVTGVLHLGSDTLADR